MISILLWDLFCPAFWAPMPKVFVGILGLSPCFFGDEMAWRFGYVIPSCWVVCVLEPSS